MGCYFHVAPMVANVSKIIQCPRQIRQYRQYIPVTNAWQLPPRCNVTTPFDQYSKIAFLCDSIIILYCTHSWSFLSVYECWSPDGWPWACIYFLWKQTDSMIGPRFRAEGLNQSISFCRLTIRVYVEWHTGKLQHWSWVQIRRCLCMFIGLAICSGYTTSLQKLLKYKICPRMMILWMPVGI